MLGPRLLELAREHWPGPLTLVAPVATAGIRPCTELNPCERERKYAGVFDEQPMPENFTTFSGLTLIS